MIRAGVSGLALNCWCRPSRVGHTYSETQAGCAQGLSSSGKRTAASTADMLLTWSKRLSIGRGAERTVLEGVALAREVVPCEPKHEHELNFLAAWSTQEGDGKDEHGEFLTGMASIASVSQRPAPSVELVAICCDAHTSLPSSSLRSISPHCAPAACHVKIQIDMSLPNTQLLAGAKTVSAAPG